MLICISSFNHSVKNYRIYYIIKTLHFPLILIFWSVDPILENLSHIFYYFFIFSVSFLVYLFHSLIYLCCLLIHCKCSLFFSIKREWDRNQSFVRIRFRRPTSAQLTRAVKNDEISVVETTQPLRLARQSKDNWEARTFVPASYEFVYTRLARRHFCDSKKHQSHRLHRLQRNHPQNYRLKILWND